MTNELVTEKLSGPSLLEKAQAAKHKRKGNVYNFNEEEAVELALAWLEGTVRLCQVSEAVGDGRGGVRVYTFLTTHLRIAYQNGKISRNR